MLPELVLALGLLLGDPETIPVHGAISEEELRELVIDTPHATIDEWIHTQGLRFPVTPEAIKEFPQIKAVKEVQQVQMRHQVLTELRNPRLLFQLRILSVQLEFMDKRESEFKHLSQFSNDLNNLRRRRQELQNVPYLADCEYLPSDPWRCLAFNRHYSLVLESQRAFRPHLHHVYDTIIAENDALCSLWMQIRDAQNPGTLVTYRRKALKEIQEMVGLQVPPPVPVWRFDHGD